MTVAATAWGLAPFFTARRRMALPSIILLLAFVSGLFVAGSMAMTMVLRPSESASVEALPTGLRAYLPTLDRVSPLPAA